MISSGQKPAATVGSARAFILEDDPLTAELLTAYLHSLEVCDVTIADSLADARAHAADLSRGKFAIAILDVNLPDGTSLDWAADLLGTHCKSLFLCTTRMSVEDHRHYVDRGFRNFIPKPVSFNSFRAVMSLVSAPPFRG